VRVREKVKRGEKVEFCLCARPAEEELRAAGASGYWNEIPAPEVVRNASASSLSLPSSSNVR
jgi:hypothetical protein